MLSVVRNASMAFSVVVGLRVIGNKNGGQKEEGKQGGGGGDTCLFCYVASCT